MTRPVLAMLTAVLAGCGGPAGTIVGPDGRPVASCQAQLPEGFRVQAVVATGTLEVSVIDAAGKPVAGAQVFAGGPGASAGYRLACVSGARAETDAAGVAKLPRLRAGTYALRVGDRQAVDAVAVVADQTTRITVTQAP